jgi:hypothetical protein
MSECNECRKKERAYKVGEMKVFVFAEELSRVATGC